MRVVCVIRDSPSSLSHPDVLQVAGEAGDHSPGQEAYLVHLAEPVIDAHHTVPQHIPAVITWIIYLLFFYLIRMLVKGREESVKERFNASASL